MFPFISQNPAQKDEAAEISLPQPFRFAQQSEQPLDPQFPEQIRGARYVSGCKINKCADAEPCCARKFLIEAGNEFFLQRNAHSDEQHIGMRAVNHRHNLMF